MSNEQEIDRMVKANGITRLQAYRNIKTLDMLRRRGDLAKAGYRHLMK